MTDPKALAHLALLQLPIVWFSANNKVVYVCTMHTAHGRVLYEKASKVKPMKIDSLCVFIMMMV